MLYKYTSDISDKQILKYLEFNRTFKDSKTIFKDLKSSVSNMLLFESQLALLTAKNKLLAIKVKDRFIYSVPEKLKSGKMLSGVMNSDTYLMIAYGVN